MKWFILEENLLERAYRTAGIKARDDTEAILAAEGYKPLAVRVPKGRDEAPLFKKLALHAVIARRWRRALRAVGTGDTVFIQFPPIHHTLFLDGILKDLARRGVKTVAFIHDLELLRLSRSGDLGRLERWRLQKEELSSLSCFSKIIVHNESMGDYISRRFGIPKERLVPLGIFDYLVKGNTDTIREVPQKDGRAVVIAGNLDRLKSGYAYRLPKGQAYELYGPNYTGEDADGVRYHGSFPPDTLPFVLKGGWGLVWDGDSPDTCAGAWGEYLKYNNPHKTSLYLASGLPVILWKEAALADFIQENGCGITVRSLSEIPEAIDRLSSKEYKHLREGAEAVGALLREGYYTKRALKESE